MIYGKNKKIDKRTPLDAAPLRQAGQSLDEEIQRVLDDEVLANLIVVFLAVVLAINEWGRAISNTPPQPVLFTMGAIAAVAYAVRKIVVARRKLEMLRLARDGERTVAEELDKLRSKGYRVLHDIVGDDFNIDHLLIGPKGVFTIETKTVSKPARGKTEIDYDGMEIVVNGFKPDRDPVVQAKAQASWVKGLISDLTGKTVAVRPTVVYPGWFIRQVSKGRPDVWVLNPKALGAFIENSAGELNDEDVHSFHAHLSRYVRNTAK